MKSSASAQGRPRPWTLVDRRQDVDRAVGDQIPGFLSVGRHMRSGDMRRQGFRAFPRFRSPRRCLARTSPGTARYPSRRYAPHTRYIPFPPEPPGRWLETRPGSLRGAPGLAVITATTRIIVILAALAGPPARPPQDNPARSAFASENSAPEPAASPTAVKRGHANSSGIVRQICSLAGVRQLPVKRLPVNRRRGMGERERRSGQGERR